jgi:hypothetical protein
MALVMGETAFAMRLMIVVMSEDGVPHPVAWSS